MTDDDARDAGRGDARENGDARSEPLGELAAEVRERTGKPRRRDRSDAGEREGPLADVAAEVDERRRREEGRFESVEVGEIDGERLWRELSERDGVAAEAEAAAASVDEAVTATDAPVDGAAETEPAESVFDVAGEPADRADDVRTIPKGTCHGCPHFGDPPELGCTHEGTEILAMPDVDHFRVADCPMVDDEGIETLDIEADG